MKRRRAALSAIMLAGATLAPLSAAAECGYSEVTTAGTVDEQATACRALHAVAAYFEAIGYDIDPSLNISFREQVFVEVSPGHRQKLKAAGTFDPSTGQLNVTSVGAASRAMPTAWGIRWDDRIAYSVLQHEHAAAQDVLGADYARLGIVWHEFVAYSVQFDLMEEDLRQDILERFESLEPLEVPSSLNVAAVALSPHTFGVRAYLFTRQNGSSAYIRQLFDRTISFPPSEDASIDYVAWDRFPQ